MNKNVETNVLGNIQDYLIMLFVDSVYPNSNLLSCFCENNLLQQIIILRGIFKVAPDSRIDYLDFLFSLFFRDYFSGNEYLLNNESILAPFVKECLAFICMSETKTTESYH